MDIKKRDFDLISNNIPSKKISTSWTDKKDKVDALK
jgi:hypothetical protein